MGDLTTQARLLLVRNEELETQLSEAHIECEENLNELNTVKKELQDKLHTDDAKELAALKQKYDDALEMIQILQAKSVGKDDEDSQLSHVKRLEEENLELREVVDHLVRTCHSTVGLLTSLLYLQSWF